MIREFGPALEGVREASGCDALSIMGADADGPIPESRLPTTEELVLINEVLDPKGLRFKEVSNG